MVSGWVASSALPKAYLRGCMASEELEDHCFLYFSLTDYLSQTQKTAPQEAFLCFHRVRKGRLMKMEGELLLLKLDKQGLELRGTLGRSHAGHLPRTYRCLILHWFPDWARLYLYPTPVDNPTPVDMATLVIAMSFSKSTPVGYGSVLIEFERLLISHLKSSVFVFLKLECTFICLKSEKDVFTQRSN